ncbi:MAG: IS66 family insertion sequence hypothetical protein [Pseudoalteromonas sp.]|nr:IS66 family insertion sequence hypothetical protein [Pseudoalteromonas sp.]|tara:strand:+ start:1570 stop:1857 length:288 start_codon:yes stop_codon:yes gene_type:complete
MAKTPRRTAAQWQQLIQAQEISGLTIQQFCAEHQLTLSNFYLQRKKLHQRDMPVAQNKEAWLPLNELVQVQQERCRWQIELTLPNGVVLNMSSGR